MDKCYDRDGIYSYLIVSMKFIKLFTLIALTWFIAHTLYIIVDGTNSTKLTTDVALILGNKINEDGTLSERLIKRLECGIDLYKNHQVKRLIVSGGLGKEGFYEGSKMKEYLMKQDIPDTCIIVDDNGDDTEASVDNTLNMNDSMHFKSITVVSQYFHVTRTKMLFKRRGFEIVYSASPNYYEWGDLYSLVREFFAFYIEYF